MRTERNANVTASAVRFVQSTAATWSIVLASIAIYFFPRISIALEYDRRAILAGQVWRSVTCYAVHWSADHLFWDVLMFAVLGCLVERRSRRLMIGLCLTAAMAISLGIGWWREDVAICRGLSGIDTALFTYLSLWTMGHAVAQKDWLSGMGAGVMLMGFSGKVLYESLTGNTLFANAARAGFLVAVESHLIGAAIGLLCGALVGCVQLARVNIAAS